MLALSIRQPWAWLILHAGKDIENRDWPTRVRGRILVHAAKGMTREEWDDAAALSAWVDHSKGRQRREVPKALDRGCLVGTVEIVDCVEVHPSPWFFGRYGFVLRDPLPRLVQIPYRGRLGFFSVPDELVLNDGKPL